MWLGVCERRQHAAGVEQWLVGLLVGHRNRPDQDFQAQILAEAALREIVGGSDPAQDRNLRAGVIDLPDLLSSPRVKELDQSHVCEVWAG
jgi:hypothetical protein